MRLVAVPALLLLLAAAAEAEAGRASDPLLSRLSFGRSDQPVEVTAERLDFAYEERLLTYTGKVVVEQGEIRLRCDRLVIALDAEGDLGLRSVVAEGNVVLTQGARRATGRRAVFDQRAQTVVLSGNALLEDGPNRVSGERIEIDLARETSVVRGGEGRVRAVLYPPTPARAEEPGAAEAGDDG